MTKDDPRAGNPGANVNAGSGDTAMLPRLILVADDAPAGDALWLTGLLLAVAARVPRIGSSTLSVPTIAPPGSPARAGWPSARHTTTATRP